MFLEAIRCIETTYYDKCWTSWIKVKEVRKHQQAIQRVWRFLEKGRPRQ